MTFEFATPTTTTPRQHHEFSPSRLQQYSLCPGSYWMQKGLPEQPSAAADEGTMLHVAVATGKIDNLTPEQMELVEMCMSLRMELLHKGYHHYGSEVHLVVKDADGKVLTEGWADDVFVSYVPGSCTVVEKAIAVDYKFGWTRVVEAKENTQTCTYALALHQLFECPIVEAILFQPRIHFRSSYEFIEWPAILVNIKDIIEAARSSKYMWLKPSEAACRYCRARLACPAFRINFQNMQAAASSYDLTNPTILERLYDASKGVKKFLGEIEDAVKTMIEATGRCGKYGFKITDGKREVISLTDMFQRCSDYISQGEFLDLCSIPLGKLESLVADRIKTEADTRGEKITKTEAKRRFFDATRDLVKNGKPTKTITVIEE